MLSEYLFDSQKEISKPQIKENIIRAKTAGMRNRKVQHFMLTFSTKASDNFIKDQNEDCRTNFQEALD